MIIAVNFPIEATGKKRPEKFRPSTGFEPVTSAIPPDTGAMFYQLSYEATHWERGQFIEFISPARSEMMWSIYEIIHICIYFVRR